MSSEFEINATASLATLSSEMKNITTMFGRLLDREEARDRRVQDLEIRVTKDEADAEARDVRLGVVEETLSSRTLTWPKLLAGTAAAGAIIGSIIGIVIRLTGMTP